MNIGDLFFKAQLDDSRLAIDAKKSGDKAGAAAGKSFSSRLSKEIKTGIGIGAGFQAFNIVGRAITQVTDYLQDSAKAFIDEQQSISGLNASLKANVPYWDGQTKAIERVLTARMALGFSDDEQRESLKKLLAATHNISDALDIERTAMDLARFKRISLADATDALIKVEGGQYRALKGLGIVLEKGATQTEALAAVQKVANGQAEAYAQTIEGKLTVAQVKMNEAQEKFGKGVAELQAQALPLLADAVDFVATTLERADLAQDSLTKAFEHFRSQGIEPTKDQLQAYARELYLAALSQDAFVFGISGVTGQMGSFSRAVQLAGKDTATADDKVDSLGDTMADTAAETKNLADEIDALSATIEDELFGKAITAGNEARLKQNIADLIEQRKAATAGSLEFIRLTGEIAENEKALFDLHLEQAEKAGPQAAIDFLEKEKKKAGANRDVIQQLIEKYRTLAGMKGKLGPIILAPLAKYGGKANDPKLLASGGRYRKNQPRIVGEDGPEWDIPDHSGYIVPNPGSMAGVTPPWAGMPDSGAMGGSTSITNVSVQLPGLLRAETPTDVVRTLRHLNVYGTFRK